MIRFFLRLFGLALVAVALVTIVLDGTQTIAASAWSTTPLGQYWYQISPTSLNITQAAIQRHVNPVLWDPVLLTLLVQPVWVVAGPLGFLLLWLGERRWSRRRPEFV
ncbi:hypothetical protein H1W37_12905 [Stappia taiwanensis]|uniref:Uncharacterized protein n=1 Tax=Stappia taiwanensis TaxID=992267 RepID=A0A838XVB2_9HYPH|nr:hypothetical protein [Stappia taiwanensis]MBA4612558.1 hypothetical protein [Stappia taiwanensis]GGE89540.1 hypothetical protein GCM10007285_16260 [Stappia taiwanensis]